MRASSKKQKVKFELKIFDELIYLAFIIGVGIFAYEMLVRI